VSEWLGSTASLFAVETVFIVVNGSFENKLILFTCFMLSISFYVDFTLELTKLTSFCSSRHCDFKVSQLQLIKGFSLTSILSASFSLFLTSSVNLHCLHYSLKILRISFKVFTSFNKVWMFISILRQQFWFPFTNLPSFSTFCTSSVATLH